MTLLNMVFAPFLLICPLDAVHACPTGVPSRPTPKATGHNLRKGTQTRYGAGVRTSQRRVADFGMESVRPKGGGALSAARGRQIERQTRRSRPVQRPFLMARVAKASSETRRVNHNTTGKNDNGT